MRHHELRHAYAVMREQYFLGESFVLAEQQAVGSGARVADLHQIQQRGDIGLKRAIVVKRFALIEDHVGRERPDLFDDGGDVVEDRHRHDVVPEALETLEHVGFGGLVFLEELGGDRR